MDSTQDAQASSSVAKTAKKQYSPL